MADIQKRTKVELSISNKFETVLLNPEKSITVSTKISIKHHIIDNKENASWEPTSEYWIDF